MDKDISTEQKTWQVHNSGKRNVFRLDLNQSREGFCQRERGRSGLPISERIKYKVACMCFSAINGSGPA